MNKSHAPVALCCASVGGFLRAHAWSISNQRTAILLSRNDWRYLGELVAHFGCLEVLSDVADDPELAPFSPSVLPTACDAGLPMVGLWPNTLSILLTSGSTGKPKQIVKTRCEIQGEQASLKGLFVESCTGALFLATVPLEHMFGYTFGYWLPTFLGAEIYDKRVVLPQDVRQACAQAKKPVWLVTTPTHIRAYVSLGIKFANVAGVICATAPLSCELASRGAEAFGVAITEIYGSTETGAMATRLRLADETAEPDWLPLPGMTITTDDDGVATCQATHLGTAITLGDLLEPGRIGFRIRGRSGDLVKVAGKRQSLAGLNTLLSSIPGVRDGAYFFPSVQNADRPEAIRPAVFVVMEPGCPASKVVDTLRGRIDDVFIPRNVFQVEALPRLETGKLRDSDLEHLFRACQAEKPVPNQ